MFTNIHTFPPYYIKRRPGAWWCRWSWWSWCRWSWWSWCRWCPRGPGGWYRWCPHGGCMIEERPGAWWCRWSWWSWWSWWLVSVVSSWRLVAGGFGGPGGPGGWCRWCPRGGWWCPRGGWCRGVGGIYAADHPGGHTQSSSVRRTVLFLNQGFGVKFKDAIALIISYLSFAFRISFTKQDRVKK